jgi:hypothetical protein
MQLVQDNKSLESSSSAPPFRPRNASPLRIIAIAVVIGVVGGLVWQLTSGVSRPLFKAHFGSRGLVTNEFAYQNPTSPLAVFSPVWEVTSGSLFANRGGGWTGVPDGDDPGPTSTTHTGSSVFRLRTIRTDFQDVSVSFRLKVEQFSTTARTPAQPFDGVHVWLRYQNADWLYFVSLVRRDGEVVIGKKLPMGSSLKGGGAVAAGGVYFHEVRKGGHHAPLGEWQRVSASIMTQGPKVIIRAFINGQQVARLIDNAKQDQVISKPGAVGIRGDNTEFEFKDFQVTKA